MLIHPGLAKKLESSDGQPSRRKQELENLLNKNVADNGLDLFFFVVTDILNNDSVVLALGKLALKAEAAFGVNFENNTALLKGVVSRKKQVVPALTEALTN